MPRRTGFDNEKYLQLQSCAILERMERFGSELYLEFGGKLLYDYHAARVLPGYDPNVKIRLLRELKDRADIILCIHAGAIERKKVRADFGITYDADALRLIDELRDRQLDIAAVVITRFEGQPAASVFRNKLLRRDIRVYTHPPTKGYPANVDRIVSGDGYGANAYIETTHPLVVVTGPGPGSGKLATCLSQLYHDWHRGIHSGYAKFETFPIWNLPPRHPVNIAYEAATADLLDVNLIDPHHLEAYGKAVTNYNRDVEAFPVLRRIVEKITAAESFYKSPTDMGVNQAGFAITDEGVVIEASRQEIVRRYFRYACEYAMGVAERETVERLESLMEELEVKPHDRSTVAAAREIVPASNGNDGGNKGVICGAAIELPDGSLVTGRNSPLMHAASAVVLNAIKRLAALPAGLHLLPPTILASIAEMKEKTLKKRSISLDLEETLIALAISSTSNPAARMAMEKLADLRGCEVHMTHIPTPGDEAGLRRLGVNLTSEPNFATKDLFVG